MWDSLNPLGIAEGTLRSNHFAERAAGFSINATR